MSFRRNESYQQYMLRAFVDVASRDGEGAANIFKQYVSFLGGNFDLAVNNVGDALFGMVMVSEHSISKEQRKEKPGVFEAIHKARVEMKPQEMTLCN